METQAPPIVDRSCDTGPMQHLTSSALHERTTTENPFAVMAAQAAIHDKLPQAEGFEGILLPLAALNRIRMPDCCTFVVDGRLRGHDEVYENRIGSGGPTIHAISPNRSAQPLSEPALRP